MNRFNLFSNKEDEFVKYYGVIQGCHGADHVYLYTEEQINAEFEKYGINRDYLPESAEDTGTYDILWPMGGSNSSATYLELCETKEDAVRFLTQTALGPDFEDPELVDLAEYYWQIETDEGCAGDIITEFGINKEETEKDAIAGINSQIEEICGQLHIRPADFYQTEYRDIRVSEVA